jgi:predicted kinase
VEPHLIVLSGIPGTGKTRLANALSRQLKIPSFSKDRFQSVLRTQELASREGVEGYELLFDIADQQLSLGISAILDAVFPMAGFRYRAQQLAELHGASFRPIMCSCSDDGLLKGRLTAREQFVPNWTPVGWDEVLRVRADFQPWRQGSALELDADEEEGGPG